MGDINVTVIDFPLGISVSTAGTPGPPGPSGTPGPSTTINGVTGNVTLSGAGNVSITTGVGVIYISGAATSSSSAYNFYSTIPSGSDHFTGSFPTGFSSIPFIYATLQIPTGSNNLYSWAINQVTTSGFKAVFSAPIQETGLVFNVKCN